MYTSTLHSCGDMESAIIKFTTTARGAIPHMNEFISYMGDTWIAGMFPINMWNVYQATGPLTNNHLEGWHKRLNKTVGNSHPNLFELIRTFQQEEASIHMTILQFATGGWSRPHKKQCVEINRRIETMMQRFKDSTISLIDYLSAWTQLPCMCIL